VLAFPAGGRSEAVRRPSLHPVFALLLVPLVPCGCAAARLRHEWEALPGRLLRPRPARERPGLQEHRRLRRQPRCGAAWPRSWSAPGAREGDTDPEWHDWGPGAQLGDGPPNRSSLRASRMWSASTRIVPH